jgi:hypothetical protein
LEDGMQVTPLKSCTWKKKCFNYILLLQLPGLDIWLTYVVGTIIRKTNLGFMFIGLIELV